MFNQVIFSTITNKLHFHLICIQTAIQILYKKVKSTKTKIKDKMSNMNFNPHIPQKNPQKS